MSVVIILCMCRHCDTVICRPVLCEWLLYCARVVTVIHLYVAQCYVSGYYTVHVSSLCTVICSPVLCVWLLYGACAVTVIVMCSPMLCEWLLYCARVVTVIQLYVAQSDVSGYYTVHVSSL
jgi:hypothetical protein